jgi:uncharacterized protein (TIGR02588 family)
MNMKKIFFIPERTSAEKASFAISLIILGFILALLIFTWIAGDGKPPILTVNLSESIYQENYQFYVPYTVTNVGGQTAESVEVSAQLIITEQIQEHGSQYINYLSPGEKESGAFVFTHPPRLGKLIIRVASFKLP